MRNKYVISVMNDKGIYETLKNDYEHTQDLIDLLRFMGTEFIVSEYDSENNTWMACEDKFN